MCAITPPGDSQYDIVRLKSVSYEKQKSVDVIQNTDLICNVSRIVLHIISPVL